MPEVVRMLASRHWLQKRNIEMQTGLGLSGPSQSASSDEVVHGGEVPYDAVAGIRAKVVNRATEALENELPLYDDAKHAVPIGMGS
jgi:hypothetical protein